MSLIAWYPLTGHLDDLAGGNKLTYVNNSGVLVTNQSGKIGSCYERTAKDRR